MTNQPGQMRLLAQPGLFAARRPVLTAIVVVCILVLSLLAVPKMRFDDDINRVFLSQNEASQDYRNFVAQTGGPVTELVLLVEKDTPFNAADYETMRTFALDMEFMPGVKATVSPFSARFSPAHPLYAGEPVIPSRADVETIATRLRSLAESEVSMSSLISEDRSSALFVITGRKDDYEAIARQVQDVATTAITDALRLTITGESAMSRTIVDALKSDLLVLNAIGSALVLALAIAVFRSSRLAALAVGPALAGVIATIGLFVWLDYPITVISNVLPILVLVFGIADGMHLLLHLRDHTHHLPREDRLAHTMREVGPACVLSALTTAIGFLAVAISDNDQLFEFAIAGALSVLIATAITLSCFAVLGRFAFGFEPANHDGEPSRILASIADSTWRSPRAIIGSGAVLMLVTSLLAMQTTSWFSYEQNLPIGSPLAAANKAIAANFGGTYRLWAELDLEKGRTLEDPAEWQRLRQVTTAVAVANPNSQTLSLASLAEWLGRPESLPSIDELQDIPADVRGLLLSTSDSVARVMTLVPEPMSDMTTLERHDAVEAAAKASGADRVVGLPAIMRHESIAIIKQLGTGLVAATIVATVLIAATLAWPMLGFILLMPNLLPLATAAAALHILDAGHLTPTAVLALTISFGIAVNDSIHCVIRYRAERLADNDPRTALRNTITSTGKVMALTTLLLTLGMVVTQFSAFEPVRLFGQLMIVSFVTALLADLVLLPALLKPRDDK